jgi:protoporphyrinogen oxidase
MPTDQVALPGVKKTVVCIGAGPAGLTAAYLLAKRGWPVEVFEADPVYVGGISRTVDYKGFKFDIGGHRFFSKSPEVNALWEELLGPDMLTRTRLSRIYYKRKFFGYPLDGLDVVAKLGLIWSILGGASFVKARLFPTKNPRTYEEFMVNRFGRRLFEVFFKTYTEKVWGMKTSELSADWAAQRVRDLNLGAVIRRALLGPARAKAQMSLITEFRYPKEGPGMMWGEAARRIRALGGRIHMGTRVEGLSFDASTRRWRIQATGPDGARTTTDADHVISSAPIRTLLESVTPKPQCLESARRLRYRDFLIAVLILKGREPFPDTWIYLHNPDVRAGRIQNYRAWSPHLVPRADVCSLGMEYFCFGSDPIWNMTDAEILKTAAAELETIGLGRKEDVVDGCVVRQSKAYPVYDLTYQAEVDRIREDVRAHYPGLHLVGRNGMHKYNNQDHSMVTAMLTVENIVAGAELYDVWRVNADAEYHEEQRGGLRQVPLPVSGAR